MKKFLTLLLVCVLTVCMLASCGGKRFEYNYDEYLTLGNYKGVEVSVAEIEEQIEAQYDSILSANAKDVETGKPAAEGNKISYTMSAKVNGADVAELEKTSASFTLGTGTTGLDDLDAAVVGMSVGDSKEVTLTIPESYGGLPVVAVSSRAFINNSTLQTVYLPETVTEIGEEAFKNCTALAHVYLPEDSVTLITLTPCEK